MIRGRYVPTRMTAAHQNAAAEPGVFDGVADQLQSTVPKSRAPLITNALVETVLISIPFRKAVSWFSQ